MEKRLPIAMLVNLASAQAQGVAGAELTYTNNVSAHGACVVSNRSWQPGEVAEITSLLDQIAMRGKVVYCHKCDEDRYAVGLSFQNSAVIWSIYMKYSGRAQEPVAVKQKFAR
jgi:PilZ domain